MDASIDQKLQICKRLKKGASITSLSKELGLGKSTICDIKRNEDKLVTFGEKLNSAEASKTRKAMKAAKDKKLDEAVAMWFMQKRSEGVPISGPILMAKALQFHAKLYPDGGEECIQVEYTGLEHYRWPVLNSRHLVRLLMWGWKETII